MTLNITRDDYRYGILPLELNGALWHGGGHTYAQSVTP